jgi:hypothetical protein
MVGATVKGDRKGRPNRRPDGRPDGFSEKKSTNPPIPAKPAAFLQYGKI